MSGHVCGTGVWSGPLPGDPDTNAILTATPAFGGIDVTWTAAITNAHAVAHTYLYRSTTPDFATSVRIALVGGTHFYDKLENQLTYYYWIQVVSINGTVGQVIGPAFAVPRLSIDETIIGLTGKIDQGFLAESLRSEIDRVKLLDFDLAQEIQDRITANELLGSALAAVQSETGQAVTLIAQEVQDRSTAYNALLQSFNILAAGVADNTAAIINEQNIRTALTDSFAQDIDTLYTESGANTAAITAESIARTNAIESVSQTFEGLLAATESELTGTITAAITTEQNARTTALDAVATQITALQAAVAEDGADFSAALAVEESARVAGDSALATQISTVQSTLSTKGKAIFSATAPGISDRTENNVWYDTSNGNNTPKMWNGSAWVGVSDKVALNALAATVTNAAAIQTETNARISADDALATQITTAQSTLGSNLAAAQTTLQTNINTVNGKVTEIGALYTAKVQANGLIGGFGVYNDGTEVQAGFDVDTFWVGRTGEDKKKPFIIDSVTGETYINKAVIPMLTADLIDTRGLTIKDEDGNIILGSGTGLDWSQVSGANKPVDGATRNKVFTQSSAPASPADGDIWVDTSSSPAVTKVRVSGAWMTAANMTTNTNQLTDGAGLGTTATWSNVTGAGKPENGATNGASIGSNLYRQGSAVLENDFIATWNKITDSNVTTYIANAAISEAVIGLAAISTAKIKDGAITSAKIGNAEIDSLKLKGAAVTVPVAVTGGRYVGKTGAVNVGGVNYSKQRVNRGVIYLDEEGIVYATCQLANWYGSGERYNLFQIVITDAMGNRKEDIIGGLAVMPSPVVAASGRFGPGAVTAEVFYYTQDDKTHVSKSELFMIGAKR